MRLKDSDGKSYAKNWSDNTHGSSSNYLLCQDNKSNGQILEVVNMSNNNSMSSNYDEHGYDYNDDE